MHEQVTWGPTGQIDRCMDDGRIKLNRLATCVSDTAFKLAAVGRGVDAIFVTSAREDLRASWAKADAVLASMAYILTGPQPGGHDPKPENRLWVERGPWTLFHGQLKPAGYDRPSDEDMRAAGWMPAADVERMRAALEEIAVSPALAGWYTKQLARKALTGFPGQFEGGASMPEPWVATPFGFERPLCRLNELRALAVEEHNRGDEWATVARDLIDNLQPCLSELREMVLIKRQKDREGKTPDYEARRVAAWERAEELIAAVCPITPYDPATLPGEGEVTRG